MSRPRLSRRDENVKRTCFGNFWVRSRRSPRVRSQRAMTGRTTSGMSARFCGLRVAHRRRGLYDGQNLRAPARQLGLTDALNLAELGETRRPAHYNFGNLPVGADEVGRQPVVLGGLAAPQPQLVVKLL